jgi:hypothetical protein
MRPRILASLVRPTLRAKPDLPVVAVTLSIAIAMTACQMSTSTKRDVIVINGIMDVRAASDVTLGAACSDEARRDLQIQSDSGSLLSRPLLQAGQWTMDPDVAGAVICSLRFSAKVPSEARYVFREGDSPPLSFGIDDVKGRELRFFAPSQFFDPSKYVRPTTSRTHD